MFITYITLTLHEKKVLPISQSPSLSHHPYGINSPSRWHWAMPHRFQLVMGGTPKWRVFVIGKIPSFEMDDLGVPLWLRNLHILDGTGEILISYLRRSCLMPVLAVLRNFVTVFLMFSPLRHSVVISTYHLVGGLEHQFYFPIYWECHHPNWLSYFSEGWPNHQPVMVSHCFPYRFETCEHMAPVSPVMATEQIQAEGDAQRVDSRERVALAEWSRPWQRNMGHTSMRRGRSRVTNQKSWLYMVYLCLYIQLYNCFNGDSINPNVGAFSNQVLEKYQQFSIRKQWFWMILRDVHPIDENAWLFL